jgi:hypothetical protein
MDPTIIECSDQLVVRPAITTVDNRPILAKTPAIATAQTMAPIVELVLRDDRGRPINFESCGFQSVTSSSLSSSSPSSPSSSSSLPSSPNGKVFLKGREALDTSNGAPLINVEAYFTNAAAGVIRAKIPASATQLHQIVDINCGVVSTTGELIHLTNLYMLVDKSQFGSVVSSYGKPAGLPSLAQIRTYLRDSAPEDNPLLNNFEFDVSEIVQSMVKCVEHWNTMQPTVRQTFNTNNFLNPTVLITGVMGELYFIAAKHYRRNQLAYTAGGLSVDDKNKAQEYEAIGDRMFQEYVKWCRMVKIQINKEAWDGTFGSGYDGLGRYR